jgi:hypothetical protein
VHAHAHARAAAARLQASRNHEGFADPAAAWRLQNSRSVSAHQQRISPAPQASTSLGGGPRAPAIGQLAALVGDVVSQLERSPTGQPLQQMVAECNAALEGCLEAQRDARDREDRALTARDDLKRLAGLLAVADHADVVFVMRQIRRVLGRFDVRGA